MDASPRRVVLLVLPPVLLVATVAPLVFAGVPAAVDAQTTTQAADATEVRTCRTISEPGTYVLTTDINNGGRDGNFTFISQSCIEIESSDVTFDGNGHTVDGYGVSDTTAIRVGGSEPRSNVTITDVRVKDWNRGVYLADVTDATVRDADVSGNSFGVFAEDSTDLTVRNVTARQYFVGVYLGDSEAMLTETSFTANQTRAVVREGASETSTASG